MSVWTRALSAALVDFLWQGAIVGLLLWVALVALRHRSASARYAVSCAALATMSALPLVTIATLWQWSAAPLALTSPAAAAPAVAVPQTMLPIWLVSDPPRIAWLERVQWWALPFWSAGVLLFSLRFVWSYRHSFSMHRGEPCTEPEVLSAVTELARRVGITRPVRVLASSIADGPAVVGWLRPAILLPPATAMGITPQQLQAVLAHELAHIKRHDYLVNLLQVAAETLFFYHPAVWWVSKQIRIERELCCDDVAVRACGDPVSYARALTTLARRQLTAPAVSMAATGGSLMHRVQRLINGTEPREYTHGRAPGVLVVAVALACTVSSLDWLQAFSQTETPNAMRFDVASVKVNRQNNNQVSVSSRAGTYTASGVTLGMLIRSAYQVQQFQIISGPDWMERTRFDVVAKEPDGLAPPPPGSQGPSRQQLMLRGLLEDRFGLAVHKETRELPIYALVLARPDGRLGPNLTPSSTDCAATATQNRRGAPPPSPGQPARPVCGTSVSPGFIQAGGRTMAHIATEFSVLSNTGSSLNRLIVDRTGLSGTFDMTLRFTPENIPNFGPGGPPPGMPPIDPDGASIFAAVQEQLGLKLDSQRGQVEVLVIDRVQMPTQD